MFEFNATLIVAMISFVVFMFIMNAIFYRPILDIIRKRDNMVNENYEDAKTLTNEAKQISDEYHLKLNDAKEQNRNNMSVEIENAQKLSFEKLQHAKDQAKFQIQQDKDLLESEKSKLYQEIDSNLLEELSSQIVKKVVG